MSVQLVSPEGLMQPAPYAHVSVGTGSRHVHVAGQIARDAAGAPLAADLTGQVAHALRNVATALRGVGADFPDVVRLCFYVTEWTPDQIGAFMAGIEQVREELQLPNLLPPTSMIGVTVLYEPDVRVELEATAILD